MYEWNEEEKKIDFSHNPFSMPQGGLEALQGQDPLTIKAVAYWYPFANPDDAKRFAEGLRKAGVPE